MLDVSGLHASYGQSEILFDVALQIGAGEAVSLLGRNGMGKTTTIYAIMGIVPPQAGEIRFNGKTISGMPAFRIARSGIGLVPEGRQIFPNLSVRENLVATARKRQPWTFDRVIELFPALAARLNSPGGLLSGGEQQMLAIGRALMTNPALLILDEATEGLAPLVRADIWRALTRLKQAGQAILVVDKNVAALTRIADRHYILEKGRVVWQGHSEALRGNHEVLNRYLGI